MPARKKDRPGRRRGWRGVAVMTAAAAVVGGAGYWVKSAVLPRADAQTPVASVPGPASAAANVPAPAQTFSDYSRRVVAYIYEGEPVTREQLGDYLIDRFGADKIELLLHKRIIDDACRQYDIQVTAGEVESSLAEELQGLAINQQTFVNTLLARYHKNLYEWKEDVIRTRLQLGKLCRSRVQVTDEDVRKAFEAAYGEKVECQIILWPKGERGKADALADYARLRDNPEAFDQKAKAQPKAELAATAGKVRPFGRYVMGDDNFDRIVFRLKPDGEVSEVIDTVDGPVVVKCLRRYPADTTVTIDSVREKLVKEITERKAAREMQTAFQTLKDKARPQVFLKKKTRAEDPDGLPAAEGPRARQVVAVYNGQTPVTREDLGEFLIARYGTEQIEFLVNRRVIDKECQARGLSVTAEEIEAGLADDLKKMNVDLKTFEKNFLGPYNKNLYEWREDAVRTRVLMGKLCRDRVKVTDEELKIAFEADYGEKLVGRMILWPADQTKFALAEYAQIRDDPKAFEEKAKHQPSSTLAAQGGKIGPFGRHTLGNEDVEREAFRLQPGEVTTLIGTPEGNLVFKLDRRVPADTSVTLESVRDKLTKQVFERKVQLEMQTAFRDLRAAARPKVMLKDASKPVDLVEPTKRLLSRTPDDAKPERPAAGTH